MAVVLTGLSGVLTAVNIVATVVAMRAPGMRMFRLPIFTWNMLVTSILVLIAFPVVTSAGVMLFADRQFGAHIYDPAAHDGVVGSPILWQHLFWFFGHPEVYILVLPYFGVITEILPVFSRRPVFGYAGLVFATIAIAVLSVGVWAHHMFVTGAVLLPFFTGFSMLIAVPTGVKFFNWIGTMWGGSLVFPTPMLFAVGFLFTFLLGGLTGVMLASAPIDFHVSDSYFVVAHMHYVLFGGSVFALYAGIYYWWPEDHRTPAQRAVGQGPLLDDARRVPPHLPRAAHARARGHAPAGGRLLRQRRLHRAQPDLVDRRVPAGRLDAAVPVERGADPAGPAGHAGGRQPVGWPDARVGDDLAAAARELHGRPAPDPLAATGVGPGPPRAHLAGAHPACAGRDGDGNGASRDEDGAP